MACSGGGAGSVGGTAGTGDAFADQYCAMFQPCCQKAGLRTDGVACKGLATFAGAQGTYDATAGNACLAELRAESAKPEFCTKGPNTSSCNRVYSTSGSKQPGDACTSEKDCALSPEGDVDCRFIGSDRRMCQVSLVGKAGDSPCIGTKSGNTTSYVTSGSSTTEPPGRGYVCDLADGIRCDSKTAACTALLGEGAACTSPDPCDKAFYCDTFASKTCIKRLAVGADCSKASSACEQNATCDTTSRLCVALLADGAECTSGSKCASRSCVNGVCGGGGGTSSVALLCGKQ